MAKRLFLKPLLKKAFPNTYNLIVFAAAFCFLSLCCFAAFWTVRQAAWRADFSKWSPPGVFQMVMGQRPPPGVTNIHVSGRHYFIKRWVWMRFEATRPAMKSLAALGTPLSSAETKQFMSDRGNPNKRYDEIDRQKVNWGAVEDIAHPVATEFHMTRSSPWIWHGIIVFDYPNRMVYVQAHGD